MENIVKIFTSEDKQEVKTAIKEIIIEQFRNDMEKLDVYLFDANVIQDMIQETYEEVLGEIKEELKCKMMKKFEESMIK